MSKTIELKPIIIELSEWDKLEKRIKNLFLKQIYLPILKILEDDELRFDNSLGDLVDRINSGKIKFNRGKFTGDFNAASSAELKKLGAKWDRTHGAWRIPLSNLPPDIRISIAASASRFDAKIAQINEFLAQIVPEKIAELLKAAPIFDAALFKVNKEFKKSIKQITVAPDLTESQREKIAEGYNKDLERYVKDFTEKQISDLRKSVQDNVLTGKRYDGLVKVIQKNYDVTKNKAKFLARQETNLMMSKFKQVRYQDAGVNEYIWKCVRMPKSTNPDESLPGQVRYYHGLLDGTIQNWNNPPITDGKGNRNHPGQDYNCRCYAIPRVRIDKSGDSE